MAKLQVASAGLNSGAQTLAKKMRVSDIQTTPELSSRPCKIICVNRKYKCVQGDSRCTKEAQKKKMY